MHIREGGGLHIAVVGDGTGEVLRLAREAAEGIPLVLGGGQGEQAAGAVLLVDHLAQAADGGVGVVDELNY